MKSGSSLIFNRPPARHDDRRRESDRFFPCKESYFQPEPGVSIGRVQNRSSNRTRRAFRLMTGKMLSEYERDEPIELLLFAFVTAIAAWPLVELLVALARTANG